MCCLIWRKPISVLSSVIIAVARLKVSKFDDLPSRQLKITQKTRNICNVCDYLMVSEIYHRHIQRRCVFSMYEYF